MSRRGAGRVPVTEFECRPDIDETGLLSSCELVVQGIGQNFEWCLHGIVS